MNGQMDWGELFFPPRTAGARTRASWSRPCCSLVIAAVYEALATPTVHWLTGWFVYPPLLLRRLRALQAAARPRPLGLVGAPGAGRLGGGLAGAQPVLRLLVVLLRAGAGLGGVELGAMPSEHGANRYGPNPLKGAALSLAAHEAGLAAGLQLVAERIGRAARPQSR